MAIDRELTLTLGMTATMLACGGTREGTHATEAMTAGARPAFAMRFDVPSHAYRQRVTIYGPPS